MTEFSRMAMPQQVERIMHVLEKEDRARRAKIVAYLREEGRHDLADEFVQKLREIENGTDSARSTWHSISPAQRGALGFLAEGFVAHRRSAEPDTVYELVKGSEIGGAFRLPTLRNLCARELCHPNGPVHDPEAQFVVTERGSFVFRKGR